jgi:hypothetical protein
MKEITVVSLEAVHTHTHTHTHTHLHLIQKRKEVSEYDTSL